jgi:TPR repeat protein
VQLADGMVWRRLPLLVLVFVLSTKPSVAQVPPESSIFELVDVGRPASASVTCPCIPAPFTLPAFRPGLGWGTGPGTPEHDKPLSEAARAATLARLAEDFATFEKRVEEGLEGNGHASLFLAMQLRELSVVMGVDERLEEEAAKWLHLAAQQQHPDACMLLAYRYQRGSGVPQSDEAAAFWFQQGALLGEKVAMVALGLRYATGTGIPQDMTAAIYWWRRAGDMPLALRFLGDAYACGLGVKQDYARALRAYATSANRGEATSSTQLARMYVGGCARTNDKAAVKAFRQAADEGYADAQIALSELMLQGRDAEGTPSQAYFWARIAELRLPAGHEQMLANANAAAAARLMSADEFMATEVMVQALIDETKKR